VDGCAGLVVVPDRGGQREDALQDADKDAVRGVAAVSFQVKLTFEGLVDRFDGLAQRGEQTRSRARGLALAGRAQELQVVLGEVGLELGAVVVLVADQGLARPVRGQGRVGSVWKISSRTWRSSAFAPARANPIGSPPRVATRCRRRPQK
jgi:hypothetical protein